MARFLGSGGGQSNHGGAQAQILQELINKYIPNCKIFNYGFDNNGVWEDLQINVNNKAINLGSHGYEAFFPNYFYNITGKPLWLFKRAFGGTKISQHVLSGTGEHWVTWVETATYALNDGNTYYVVYHNFDLGETDARDGTETNAFVDMNLEYNEQVRTFYNDPTLPIITRQLSIKQTANATVENIQKIQAAKIIVEQASPYNYMYDSEDATYWDALHIDSPSWDPLSARMAYILPLPKKNSFNPIANFT